jgi:hypothetical protein
MVSARRKRQAQLKDRLMQARFGDGSIMEEAGGEWAEQARSFLLTYTGDNAILKSFKKKAIREPGWKPTMSQVLRIHRIAHRGRTEASQPRLNRQRVMDRNVARNRGSSLDDPDWISE